MNCDKCGAPVNEDPSKELLECEHCGSQFTTPDHSALHDRYVLDENKKREAEERDRQAQQRVELQRKQEASLRGRRAATATARKTFSIILIVLGVGIGLYAAPLLFQYGALRTIGGNWLKTAAALPLVKELYPFTAALISAYYFQIFVGILLGLSALLIRRGTRK